MEGTRGWRGWLATLGPPFAAGVLTAVLVGLFLTHSDYHNPFDEYTHFDFVVKVAQELDIPRMSDRMGQEALQEWACSGEPSFAALTCGDPAQDPALAPWSGSSPATSYSAPYYVLTGLATRALHEIWASLSWIDAARIASALWLVVLSALIVGVGRRLGGPTSAAVGAAVLVTSMPQVLVQGVSVSNDVPALFMALATIWVWLLLKDRNTTVRWISAVSVGTLALLFKQHAVLGLMGVGVLELGARLRERELRHGIRERLRPWLVVAGGLVIGLATYALIYYVLEPRFRGVGPPVVGMKELLSGAEPQDFGLASAKAYGSVGSVFAAPSWVPAVSGPWATVVAGLGAMVAVGGLVFAVLRSRLPWKMDDASGLRQVTLAYVMLFPVAFLVFLRLIDFPLHFQPRYHVIGLAFGLVLLLVGSARSWGFVGLAGAVGYWLFLVGEIVTLPLA